MNTNNQKNLADVQLLAEWVYSHGEQEGTYLFASIFTELEEGTASFSVTEPTQNPDVESTSLSWEVVVDMDGEHWQAFFHAMVVEKLVEMYGYEAGQDDKNASELPKNCRLISLEEAREIDSAKLGLIYVHKGSLAKAYREPATMIKGTKWAFFGRESSEAGMSRALLVTKDVFEALKESL